MSRHTHDFLVRGLLFAVLMVLIVGMGSASLKITENGIFKDGQSIEQGGLFDITEYLKVDGSNSMTGNLSLDGNSLENVQYLTPFSSTITVLGSLDMNDNQISGLADPDNAQDAATKSYVDNQVSTTSISCPSGYVKVPGSDRYDTDTFCVMKYEAKDDGSGNPVSQESGTPWVNIEQYTARQECRSQGENYHLITESEWLTIAENAMDQSSNWADGTIGSQVSNGGGLYRGNVGQTDSVSCNVADPADGTDSCSGKRTLELSNGNKVWDLSGNVWEWTDYQLVSGEMPQPADNSWHEYSGITDLRGMRHALPLNPDYDSGNGIGKMYTEGDSFNVRAVRRGGAWGSGARAGALSVNLANAPSNPPPSSLGFRCSYSVS